MICLTHLPRIGEVNRELDSSVLERGEKKLAISEQEEKRERKKEERNKETIL
tara:strand:+ start:454 stop:609 length:156 start_codon:yes stop_codon:yes gene_type:complete